MAARLGYWEEDGEEEEERQGEREMREIRGRTVSRCLKGVVPAFGSKQEVAGELQEASTQELPMTHEEDNILFAKSTLALGFFPGRLKTAHFCNIL
jgi:hypothetical protein